jgi:hypothetical protein
VITREKGKGRYTTAGLRSAGMMVVLKKERKRGMEKDHVYIYENWIGD